MAKQFAQADSVRMIHKMRSEVASLQKKREELERIGSCLPNKNELMDMLNRENTLRQFLHEYDVNLPVNEE